MEARRRKRKKKEKQRGKGGGDAHGPSSSPLNQLPQTTSHGTQDCKSPDVKLSNDADNKHGHLLFRGKGEGADPEAHEYGLDLEFFAAIDAEGSKVATSDRGVVLIVAKADKDAEEHWPRLLKASGKTPANVVSWISFLSSFFFFRENERARERERD